jgi:hypothetical protein
MRFDYSLVVGKAREYNKRQTRFVTEHTICIIIPYLYMDLRLRGHVIVISRQARIPTSSRFVGGKHIERSIHVSRELSEAMYGRRPDRVRGTDRSGSIQLLTLEIQYSTKPYSDPIPFCRLRPRGIRHRFRRLQ